MSKFLDNQSEGWKCARDTVFNRMVSDLQLSKQRYRQARSIYGTDSDPGLSAEKLQEYENIAIRDKLTGVYNARFLSRKLIRELKRGKRYKRPFSLMLVTLDKLPEIKANYGDIVTEDFLKESANTIITSVREVDLVCRLSGDQFAVLLPETDSSSAIIVAQRIIKKILTLSANAQVDENLFDVSIGLVSFPTHGRDENSLLTAALEYVDQARRLGGRQVYSDCLNTPSP